MNNLPDETPVYRYMALDSFLHFFMNRSLVLQKVCNWPDFFEGKRFEFFKNKHLVDTKYSPNDYFGSSWTLQQDDERFYDSKDCFQKSCKEIQDLGSAAMWEAYCKGGGLRVKTTIGKVLTVLRSSEDLWHGKVYYEPSLDFTSMPEPIEEALFHKRTCFRHEDEYRFIVRSQDRPGLLDFLIEHRRDFIDELLVSPSRDSPWISRAIYKLVICNVGSSPMGEGTNWKNGHQYCRISQMYGLISEAV